MNRQLYIQQPCSVMQMIVLEKGADVNICNDFGNTLLHVVIINGGDVRVDETVIKKTDFSIKNGDGQNILHVAIKYHKIDAVELILSHPQVYTVISDPDNEGYTPLHLAVSLGHIDTTKEPLNRQDLGIDISATTKKGKSIIHLAATASKANLLSLILEVPNAL